MLLRISLIVAILAGLAALYFSHFGVSERITTLTTSLEASQTAEQQAKDAESKARAEAKKSKDELDKTSKELADRTANLEATTAKLAEQQKRADQASEELVNVTRQKNEAQQEVAAFRATGVKIEDIKGQRDALVKATSERDAFVAENKILNRQINQLKVQLARYEGDREPEVPLPPGLTGNVVAVDPKYNFIILDIGEKQGVVENGKMLVNRDGKLVAQVRITKVEPNRSIANVMPDWQAGDIMEGDKVLY